MNEYIKGSSKHKKYSNQEVLYAEGGPHRPDRRQQHISCYYGVNFDFFRSKSLVRYWQYSDFHKY